MQLLTDYQSLRRQHLTSEEAPDLLQAALRQGCVAALCCAAWHLRHLRSGGSKAMLDIGGRLTL